MNTTPVPPNTTTQKLVTIYLDTSAYAKGKMFMGSLGNRHGTVEEHLVPQLSEGWRVVSVHGFGGTSDYLTRGWVTVLLERPAA